MTKYYLFLLIAIVLSSCATIINKSTVGINIYSDTDTIALCVNNETSKWHTTPAYIKVERSKNDLLLTAKNDTCLQQIPIKSRLSTAFVIGNIFSSVGVLGYLIDLTNSKRYTYPTSISIDMDSETNYVTYKKITWLKPVKNLLTFKISIPEGNHFYLNKGNGYGNAFGFLGISGGFEYYFNDKYCINMDVGGLTDFIVPFPAPYDVEGSYNRSFATYGDIQIGSDYKRLHYDAGLQFTRTSYYERETVELFPEYIDTLKYSKYQNNMGLALSAYYRLSKKINMGFNYYPSFIIMENNGMKYHYSHILFFELSFRIEVYRPKQKNDNRQHQIDTMLVQVRQ
jgi:uncharacterized protein YceK